MRWSGHIRNVGAIVALAWLLTACSTTPLAEAQTAITPEQSSAILAANLKELNGATPLDVDRYKPLVTVTGCAENVMEAAPASPALTEGLKPALDYHAQKGGIGIAIWHNGKLVSEVYREGVDRTSRTESFSMHKSLLALAVGLAIKDGFLPSKDVPVGTFLPEWADDARGKIPLSAFLNMESGLELYSMGGPQSAEAMSLVMSGDITKVALGHDVVEPPNRTFRYNNANSQIVGTVLNRALNAAGKRGGYAAYVSQNIWCPLGNQDGAVWLDRDGGAPHYFSGMQATLLDWLRVGVMIGNNGQANGKQIIPADWLTQMAEPAPNNPNYGLHLWLGSPAGGRRAYSPESPMKVPHAEPYLADDVVFFDGFGGQRVYIVPSRKLVVARTSLVDFTYDDSVILNTILRVIAEGEQ